MAKDKKKKKKKKGKKKKNKECCEKYLEKKEKYCKSCPKLK
jgi:hypothetical protein